MGMMHLEYESKAGWMVDLYGGTAKFWRGEGLPDYEGPIEGLPEDVLKELLDKQLIKATD